MKAIVANVLFGGIFGCLSYANSTQATPLKPGLTPVQQLLSSEQAASSRVPVIPQLFDAIENVLTISQLPNSNPAINGHASLSTGSDQWLKQVRASSFQIPLQGNYFFPQLAPKTDCTLEFCDDRDPLRSKFNQVLFPPQQIYLNKGNQADLALGFQKTFWPSKNLHQYWGLTTIEHWGKTTDNLANQQLIPTHQLNYTDAAPVLASGVSMLTLSGGGNHNLRQSAVLDRGFNLIQPFEDFRGGITYHRGIDDELTMGAGFFYDHTLGAFAQLTYDSDILPIKTTFSLLKKDAKTELYSHIRFQPAPNFVANYYSDAEKQRFDANWGVYPGLNLIARGNSKTKSYSLGVQVAIHNDYLSLNASAALDREQNIHWQVNTQIGGFKFAYNNNFQNFPQNQNNWEISSQLINSDDLGIKCAAFIRYQTFAGKIDQQFTVWGASIDSPIQADLNHRPWHFDIGYGTSNNDQGWIAHSTIALKHNLFLKLGYQEISALSDETRINLQISSNGLLD